jgi:hypothetical protein
MKIFMYRVADWYEAELGICLEPGLRMGEINQRPELKTMIQGITLELRYPDGTVKQTTLSTYGVSATKAEDGSLIMAEDPYLRLFVPSDVGIETMQAGIEIWWVQEVLDTLD